MNGVPHLSICNSLLSVSLILAVGGCTGPADADWPVYQGPGSNQYSALDQITPENVGRLEVAWTYESGDASPDGRSQIQCNPIIVDGVLYATSPALAPST